MFIGEENNFTFGSFKYSSDFFIYLFFFIRLFNVTLWNVVSEHARSRIARILQACTTNEIFFYRRRCIRSKFIALKYFYLHKSVASVHL